MKLLTILLCVLSALGVAAPLTSAETLSPPHVEVLRVPHDGIQPDVVVDAAGVLHVVYMAGPTATVDTFE